MYRAALLNTSEQASFANDGTAYVKTGDIPAEWLRDASAQVRPYLFFAKNDVQVASLLRGIIAREGKYLQIDPYANAFTLDYRVWEEKFELDSLAYPIILSWSYWKATGDASIFTGDLSLGFDKALETMEREQDHSRNSKYTHKELRDDAGNPQPNPVAYTGMIWTGFRPSDDACKYNYLIPSEMMAVVALGDLDEIERQAYHNLIKSNRAKTLAREVQDGIQKYGEVFTPNYGYVYAYEVDGLGHADADGRREHPEPLVGALHRLHEAGQLRVPEHAPAAPLQGRSVLLRRLGCARDRQRRTPMTATSGRSRSSSKG